ncbi:MAG TPA: WYL domain-containing protein [Bacteroidales bacterium]|nr:WYL domain-containing protein [Bacteroidales bacterium]
MSYQGTLHRWLLLLQKTGGSSYPSFEEIKSFLHESDFEISTRTLQRDIEQIRTEFGIEVLYNRTEGGYYIDYELSPDFESTMRFFEIISTAGILSDSLRDSKQALKHIIFDSQGRLRGTEHLKTILQAIRGKKMVGFKHENFGTGKSYQFKVAPYLLKEYQNRWYLIGIPAGMNDFRTFGIDRMDDLKMLAESFRYDKKLNPLDDFEHIVGLTYSDRKVETVVISVDPFQGKYLKALPLHASQKILIDNAKELRISLRIKPNFEFKQQLLMLGDRAQVLEPAWLVKDIKKTIDAMAKKYK